MKRVCTHCERVAVDGNLWCQQADCPTGDVPIALSYGDFLGDIKIMRLLRVLRTASVYEAKRGDVDILLKVAHPEFNDLLVHEAKALRSLMRLQGTALPRLKAPYWKGSWQTHPFGQTIYRGEVKYYMVFEHNRGEFMRDSLFQNPEPWYQHAGWIMLRIANTIHKMHEAGYLHLNLNPDVILLYQTGDEYKLDKKQSEYPEATTVLYPLLIDIGLAFPYQNGTFYQKNNYHNVKTDGDVFTFPPQMFVDRRLISSPNGSQPQLSVNPVSSKFLDTYIHPAYIAPELLSSERVITSPKTDVYGLGLIFFEMLKGEPAFSYRLVKESDVREYVRQGVNKNVVRPDLPNIQSKDGRTAKLTDAIVQAINANPEQRQPNADILHRMIKNPIGEEPPVKKSLWKRIRQNAPRAFLIGLGIVFIIIVIMMILLAIFDQAAPPL